MVVCLPVPTTTNDNERKEASNPHFKKFTDSLKEKYINHYHNIFFPEALSYCDQKFSHKVSYFVVIKHSDNDCLDERLEIYFSYTKLNKLETEESILDYGFLDRFSNSVNVSQISLEKTCTVIKR